MEDSKPINLTKNDILIMSKIYDKETKKGLSQARAITIQELMLKLGDELSESKIRKTLRLLIQYNFINYGVKNGKMKTYYITSLGWEYVYRIKELSVKGNNMEGN